MLEWLGLLMAHWPTVGLFATILVGVYLAARYWSAAEMRDMRRRIEYLDDQVRALRLRDEAYFAYILYAEAYHQRLSLAAVSRGCAIERRLTFLEFRDKWMKDRGLEDEKDEIWT